MLNIGIHENLVITKVQRNDRGNLVISIQKEGEIDPIEALSNAGQTSFNPIGQDITIYPPKVEAYEGGPDTLKNLLNKVAEVKDPLDHIASVYLTLNLRKWDPFMGVDIQSDNLEQKLRQPEVMAKIYNNIVDQFITMITPHIGEGSNKVRMMFIRQSKAKHYPTFRKRFLDSYPFVESMQVPHSKLKFSPYEISKGLNDGAPISGEQVVAPDEAKEAESLFAPAE